MRLANTRALVTGASRGIGRAIALAFADEGADLVITARSTEALAGVAAQIAERGRKAHPIAWEVSDPSVCAARLDEAWAALGGIDILVNNAGVVSLPAGHPNPTPEAHFDYVMDINLKALYLICEDAAGRMQSQGSGVIINLASDAGLRNAPHPYGISKWGVIGYTQGLAARLAPGVRVNAIAPGPVATEMMSWQPGMPLELAGVPLGRLALPEEIASIAVFLASADSRAVYGATIVANSGND
jgi:NAD(P)-dependent dehydrogenase (short-subunit alcohol dehydrogenase family)